MSKSSTLTKVELASRPNTGTTGSKAARHAGMIPAVVYGHGDPLSVSVPVKVLDELLAAGANHLLDATVDGKADTVMLRGVARHPISHRPIHADFQRMSRTESIRNKIAVHTSGTAIGVKDGGGVMDVVAHEIDISGPASEFPEYVTVDVSDLSVHGHITAKDVPLPKGFTLHTSPDQTIVTISAPRTAVEPTVAAEVPTVAAAADTAAAAT